jgi:hypothetical protein
MTLLLNGCGGGLFAGVGSGGSGIAEGTISGFGSVIVDGIEYDDSVLGSSADGLRLGQRVRLVYDEANAAQSLVLLPQLRGPIDSAPDENGWMRVTGQWVRVVHNDDDITRSGATTLGGYGAIAEVRAGQDTVVYGSWVFDASKQAYVVVATRLERLDGAADPVLTGGVVLSLSAHGFRLNQADGTEVQAADLPVLENGQVVLASIARSALARVPLWATQVANGSLGGLDLAGYDSVRLGGLASSYDAAARVVVIQGTRIPLAASASVDAAGLAQGQFVRIESAGARQDGGLVGDAAAMRPPAGAVAPGADDAGDTNVLKGTLSGVDWSAATVQFTLRGTPVTANAAVIGTVCRSTPASGTLYVEVRGRVPAPGATLSATQVDCSTQLPATAAVAQVDPQPPPAPAL